MRDELLDLLAAEWGGERGHGAYRSQMPDAPIRLHELESCASTQDELRALAAAGAPAFTAVRADVQHAGRGRRGRRWEAPAGHGAARLDPAAAAAPGCTSCPVLSLAGGVAAVECARGVRRRRRPELAERRRLRAGASSRGVLAELGPDGSVLLGVGMNLASRAADLRRPTASLPTSLLLETGSARARAEALAALLARAAAARARSSTTRGAARRSPARARRSTRSRARAVRAAARERRGRRRARQPASPTTAACSCAPATSVRAYASGEVVRLT